MNEPTRTESREEREMGWYLVLQLILLTAAAATASDTVSGCQRTCGNVSVPYPFGIEKGCSIDDNYFNLTCNNTFNPPKLFLGRSYEILNISLQGQLTANTFISMECYNQSAKTLDQDSFMYLYDDGPFTFSNTRNKFTAMGCDTLAIIQGSKGLNFTSGCISFCSDNNRSVVDNTCSGIGCCQTSIPVGAKRFDIRVISPTNHTDVLGFNPCSYAFLVEEEEFKFRVSDLGRDSAYNKDTRVPVVIDWVIGNKTCQYAKRDVGSFACKSQNSNCSDLSDVGGYRCSCNHGFRGNPYLIGEFGCKDIDECAENSYTCGAGKCKNTVGSYLCTTDNKLLKVILGVSFSFLFLFVASWIYWGLKRRKLAQLKEDFFRKNGGLLLQQQLSSHEGMAMAAKIFSAKDLEKATNNYDETQIVGRGGYGIVYKGVLSDGRTVAIKKSKIVDESQIEQFINEVFILSQVNHRNVVKLLGCCLETQVPLLVYEFISNGTLFHHIHHQDHSSSMSLEHRLRIALETAGALAYLHSAASIPIFHRDIKSTNILLDNNLTAKVSDFGASRLVPLDQTQIATLVQGTLGYLDPEYFHTGQLTEKSDVYSFGVVLVELLTGQQAISMDRSQEDRNLSIYFVTSLKENRLFQVLEDRVVDEGGMDELLAVAQLAKRCMGVKGEERPTMKEVVAELEGLRRFSKHPWVQVVQVNDEEIQSLLGAPSNSYNGCVVEQDSLGNPTISALELELGR